MELRFLQKKDGTKILQTRNTLSLSPEWKDIPLVKEETMLQKAMAAIELFEKEHNQTPDGLMIGFVDYEFLEDEMSKLTIHRRGGYNMIELYGQPVTKHPKKPHGIFVVKEAR